MITASDHQDDAARLRAMFKERAKLSQMAFGERYDLGTQSMVSQYLLGRRPLNIDSAMKFAEGLGCTINDLSPSLAHKINRARHYVATKNSGNLPVAIGEVPLAWQAASAEAREAANYVLSSPDAPSPEWVTSDLTHARNSLLYAALLWLREGEREVARSTVESHKKVA